MSTPRYQQLKDHIIAEIMRGTLKPGDRVPSENELAGTARVSRMTANRALRELTDQGYLERTAGVGTLVSDRKAASHVLEVRNIADEIERRGHRHTARVLQCREERAAADVARALQVDPGAPVFQLLVVHHENGTPIQLEERFVAVSFAPDLLAQDFTAVTPSAYLSAIAPLTEAEQAVRAVIPDADVRGNLHVRRQEACLLVVRRTWAGGRPATYARLYHPGPRFELTGHFVPPGMRPARPASPGTEAAADFPTRDLT
jgi:GntR family histidine utilization transcriptional repressor